MIWSSWSEFIEMGKYAFFVWWSYGITALFIAGEIILLSRRRTGILKRLVRLVRANKSRQTG